MRMLDWFGPFNKMGPSKFIKIVFDHRPDYDDIKVELDVYLKYIIFFG